MNVKRFDLLAKLVSLTVVLLCCATWSLHGQSSSLEYLGEPDGDYTFHIVETGESLFGIAQQYDMTVDELKRLNYLANNLLYTGQRLMVSGPQANRSAGRRQARSATAPQAAPRNRDRSSARTRLSAEEVWMKSHLRMLSPDGQSYIDRQRQIANQNQWNRGPGRDVSGDSKQRVRDPQATPKEYHRVEPGETLYDIAERYQVPLDRIRRDNGVRAAYPGDELVINLDDTRRSANDPGSANLRTSQVPLDDVEGILTPMGPSSNSPSDPGDGDRVGKRASFIRFTLRNTSKRFYAVHKSLPVGTRIQLAIPGNRGYLEVEVLDQVQPGSQLEYGLSPATVEVLKAAGVRDQQVTILGIDQPTRSEP